MNFRRFFILFVVGAVFFGAPFIVFAATVFSDNFNNDYGELSTHTPTTAGTSWTQVISNGGVTLSVQSYNNDVNITSNTLNAGALYQANGTYSTADYEISSKVTNFQGDPNYPRSMAVRIQDANNMYLLRYVTTSMTMYKRVSGSWSTIGSATVTNIAVGDTVVFSAIGSTLTAKVNGSTQLTVTDSSITGIGTAGIGFGYINVSTDDSGTGQHIDDVVVTGFDTAAPTVTSISSDKANGNYAVDEVIDIDVTFSEAVTSTGNVTITLETGDTDRTCVFTVSNATTGTCNYTVQVGDTSADLDATVSGTITDQSSNAMTNYTPSTGLAANKALVIDTTAPTASMTSPANSAAVFGDSIALSASASDNVAVAGVKFYVNGTLTGNEDTASPYSIIWDSTTASSSAKTIVAVARDAANNYATSTSILVTVANEPTPSSVAASAGSTGATITWTTPSAGSSRVWFGLSSTYATSTVEIDTSPRVTSHSVTITGLPSCALFHYAVNSRNAALDSATSTDATFRTSGCTGSATISASNEGSITIASGGSLTQGALVLTAPASFTATSSAATFQAHQLGASAFFTTAGAPSGKTRAGDSVFNIKALIDATTTLSTFIQPITVALTYTASDISGLTESSLWIYRYDGSSWYALNGCLVNTSAKTVTCTTTSFSDFSLFGNVAEASSSTSTTSGGGFFVTIQPRALSPASSLDFTVNNGEMATDSQLVTLALNGDPIYVRGYAVSLDPEFIYASIYNYAATASFLLPDKFGVYTLYLKYYSKTGHSSSVISHSIKHQKAATLNALDVVAPSNKIDAEPVLFTQDLKRGDEGFNVWRLQEFLNNNGFAVASDGPGSKGNETIYFGPRTQAALIKFQKAHSISPAVGYFGSISRGVIGKTKK